VKYLRFITAGGQYAADVFASGGDFIGSNDAETEVSVIASHKAAMEALHGITLTAVTGESDPWDGVSALLTAEPPPPTPPSAAEQVRNAQRDDAVLRLFMRGKISKTEMEAVTGKPYSYGVNYPAPF